MLITPETVTKSLVDLTVDSWRFAKTFARLIGKLDAGEGARYASQYQYYVKRLVDNLDLAGFKLVNVEGHPWDPGLPVTALNLEDFDPADALVIDQMIEPILMGADALVRTGTVTLKKVG